MDRGVRLLYTRNLGQGEEGVVRCPSRLNTSCDCLMGGGTLRGRSCTTLSSISMASVSPMAKGRCVVFVQSPQGVGSRLFITRQCEEWLVVADGVYKMAGKPTNG